MRLHTLQDKYKIHNPALKLKLGLVLCAEIVNVESAVKPIIIIIIIISEAPWRLGDGVHLSPHLFFQPDLFLPTGQLQSSGYGSVDL